LKRNYLVGGIIFLFIGTCILPAIAQETEKPALTSKGWLYVGGSGPGNYTTIQSAINAANPGDTVFVYSGTYYEYFIKIPKKIHLIGEDRDTTIIDGQGKFSEVLEIANDVTIQGFTVQNAGEGVGFFLMKNSSVIFNNRIRNCAQGIYNYGSYTLCEIHHNIIENNTNVGIQLDMGPCDIRHNAILSNPTGIDGNSIFLPSEVTFIVQNHFEENNLAIRAFDFHANISQNNFMKNTRQVKLYYGGALSMLSLVFLCKTQWSQNYWYHWETETPRPIPGLFVVGILFPVFLFPLIQFDWSPVQEPYDIGGI
jgi:nitrous oxidase accessory protein NosD